MCVIPLFPMGLWFVNNLDQLWHDFKSAFVSVADRHAIIQRRVRGIDNCPWLNKEIK